MPPLLGLSGDPVGLLLASLGWRDALRRDPHLANGLNVHAGHVNHKAVAHDLGYEYLSADDALKAA